MQLLNLYANYYSVVTFGHLWSPFAAVVLYCEYFRIFLEQFQDLKKLLYSGL